MFGLKKKIIGLISLLTVMNILCGCSAALKSEMVSYSRKNFGRAKCISYDYTEKKSTALMEDEQYGFTYTVTSSISNQGLDGRSMLEYENKYSDFYEKYTGYIKSTDLFTQKLKEYDADTEFQTGKYISLKMQDTLKSEEAAAAIKEVINKIDTRKFIMGNNYVIYILDKDDNEAGEYSLDDSSYSTADEARINWILDSAAISIYSLNNYEGAKPDSADFEYMYSEYMDSKDIPGRTAEYYPSRIDDTEESLAHTWVVHFKYKKQEWIVADCLGANEGHLYVYCLDK